MQASENRCASETCVLLCAGLRHNATVSDTNIVGTAPRNLQSTRAACYFWLSVIKASMSRYRLCYFTHTLSFSLWRRGRCYFHLPITAQARGMEALLMPDRLHLDLPDAPRKPGVGVFGDVFFFLHVCVCTWRFSQSLQMVG